jgi:hypothetical protein
MPPNFTQRLLDLSDNIEKDNILLKEYENAWRLEDDPRRKSRYRQEIECMKNSAQAYKQEYEELEQQATGGHAVELQNLADQLEKIDSQMNLILSGQIAIYVGLSEIRESIISRYDESERTLVKTLTNQLNQNQLVLTQTLLISLDSEQPQESEMQRVIKLLEQKILALPHPQENQLNVLKILQNPEIGTTHKLKISIPIIPFLVDYEGEIELGTSFNFQSAWKWVKNNLGRR